MKPEQAGKVPLEPGTAWKNLTKNGFMATNIYFLLKNWHHAIMRMVKISQIILDYKQAD